MLLSKRPYEKGYPNTAKYLIEEGVASTPRQRERTFTRTSGVDITYKLTGLTPANFHKYSDSLLLLAYEEAMRYKDCKWKFARFDVKLGRLKRGRDIPDIASYQANMHDEPDIMVYGLETETPHQMSLADRVEQILDIVKRYQGKVDKQNPYRVVALIISIREEF